ncbi:hypothetical protein V7S43_016357 [Phytophthora oleae]|uniref:Crinkler effector protein N-terminal domain-containing protein n=1 Tax=Phytophthora oleae TaxID=2107226 RepID=A0ABD3EZF1_9STRA
MVKLFCAIVDEVKCVLEVDINEGVRISALWDAIKQKKENDLKDVDPDRLQLFLAKTKLDAWLDLAAAKFVTIDETSEAPVMPGESGDSQGFEEMNPSLALKDPKYFGENFESGEDEIHVLVVVPTIKPPRKRHKLKEEMSMRDLWRFSGAGAQRTTAWCTSFENVSPETTSVQATTIRFRAVR